MIDGGKRGTDPGVVGDLVGVVEGNVEVGPDDHALFRKREVVNGFACAGSWTFLPRVRVRVEQMRCSHIGSRSARLSM